MNSGFQLVHVAGLTSAAGMLMVLSGVRKRRLQWTSRTRLVDLRRRLGRR
jgi:hypothetical protein